MDEVGEIMCNMMYVLKDQNATIDALRKRFPAKQGMTLEHVIPFSSDRNTVVPFLKKRHIFDGRQHSSCFQKITRS